ncbi:uncharacterized protein VICG_00063 [Vittaforma corneae ATCC 50505]|uniref:Adenylate kinase n=1 Tax=Vittaforma corneae (strain ATCC 50505) TaxID=993615 RepID=L2GPD2_VITCO|nr:uncharacterized protein VICG_00063 [Vittaforma corneae ATCC 50505]ELA42748.1 hypothetical protein VICG_00063 [Vittaforma corneae ATCC 50505]
MKILVAGTPGVGKTTLSKQIAQRVNIAHVDVTRFVKDNKLYESFDEKLDTLVFDEDTVAEHLNNHLKLQNCFIVDTHSPVVVEDIAFDYIFHVVCDIGEIGKRLELRGYSEYKIQKNIECEIFNMIGEELEETFGGKIYKINGSEVPNDDAKYAFDDVFKILNC